MNKGSGQEKDEKHPPSTTRHPTTIRPTATSHTSHSNESSGRNETTTESQTPRRGFRVQRANSEHSLKVAASVARMGGPMPGAYHVGMSRMDEEPVQEPQNDDWEEYDCGGDNDDDITAPTAPTSPFDDISRAPTIPMDPEGASVGTSAYDSSQDLYAGIFHSQAECTRNGITPAIVGSIADIDEKNFSKHKRLRYWIVVITLLLVAAVAAAVVVTIGLPSNKSSAPMVLDCGIEGDIEKLDYFARQCACQGRVSSSSGDDAFWKRYGQLRDAVVALYSPGDLDEELRTWCSPQTMSLLRLAAEGKTSVPTTRYILMVLYETLGGSRWVSDMGWLTVHSECLWEGITCNEKQEVTELSLQSNQVSGSLPIEIGFLSTLVSINLVQNELSGAIPTQISQLFNLAFLKLKSNSFESTIPTELGLMAALRWLDLSFNTFSGNIPTEVGSLTHLESLALTGNDLTGSIPAEIGGASSLTSLMLASNNFDPAPIPSGVFGLTDLVWMELSGCNLRGTLDTRLGALTSLRSLVINFNSIGGPIPSEIGLLGNLTIARLDSSRLTGTLPTEIGNCHSLVSFFVNSNQLTGPIPSELGQLNSLENAHMRGNLLTGSVSDSVCDLKTQGSLQALYVDCSVACSCCLGC